MKLTASEACLDVLIIEDDAAAAEIFEQILREHGYGVRRAADAESGIAQLEYEVPNAILMDLRLPTIDGLELLRRIRAMAGLASVPVVVITGDYLVDDEVVRQLVNLGAEIRFKPLWEEDLVRIVGGVLSNEASSQTAK